jgi:hypothetical protein
MSLDVERLADEMMLMAQAVTERAIAPLRAENAALAARIVELEARAPVAGPAGQQGEKGADGRDGVDGKNGSDGKDGLAGKDGLNGKDGLDGRDGVDGKDGLTGERGPEGRMPVARAWTDRVHYAGDIVTCDGATWQAVNDTGRIPPHDDWLCLAAPGRSLRVRGTYDAADEYQSLDIVALNGGSFVALRDMPGECPGPEWQLLTAPGKRGQKGEAGDRGDQGLKGKDSAAIDRLEVDADGLLRLAMTDGKMFEADFYPVLRALE